jgi:hypothetical protein
MNFTGKLFFLNEIKMLTRFLADVHFWPVWFTVELFMYSAEMVIQIQGAMNFSD